MIESGLISVCWQSDTAKVRLAAWAGAGTRTITDTTSHAIAALRMAPPRPGRPDSTPSWGPVNARAGYIGLTSWDTAPEGVRNPQSPSLSNWIAALSIRKRRCEEPIGPFLGELPRVCEDDRDLGVAHL